MKLLVTGGAGFIGSNFIRYWLKKYPKDYVVNFDVLTYSGNLESLKDIQGNPHYAFVRGDVREPKQIEKAIKGAEVVNRFHYIGTDEVFGALPLKTKEKFKEDTPFDPRNQYSASKAAAEHFVRSYYSTHNLPITITDCTNNFGPYQHPEKMIPLFITNILENKKIPMYGDGLYVRDWLYVEDHCRAIDLVLMKGKVGESYMVGAQHKEVNNQDLTNMILSILGKDESQIEFVKDRPGHDRRYAIDWMKIQNELGWKPRHDFDTWLTHTVHWYRDHADWWKRVKSGEYQRYYEKQYRGAV